MKQKLTDHGTKGNSNVPTKLCEVCGRLIVWRRRLDRTWEAVKYCSAVCRRQHWQYRQMAS